MSVLEVDSICKRFGKQAAVDEVSFCVEPGQVFGLLGPNGSGKTTTIACALGLLRPDSGHATLLGFPAAQIARTRGKLGAVFDQDNLIDGLSVSANLEYARRLLGHGGGRSSARALELTGIEHLRTQRAGKLSLGQRKRVAVARALLGSPELLVLDEPLSALDPMGVKDTLQLIRELAAEGISILLSSHRLHEMQSVISHAIVLVRGRRLAGGSLQELLGAQLGRYRLHLLDVDDPGAAAGWMRSTFLGLECTPLDGEESTEKRFDLAGLSKRESAAELCQALSAEGYKIAALIPHSHGLESFFEDIVHSHAGRA